MKNLAKEAFKQLLFRPRGVQAGSNTWIKLPRNIPNPSRVYIGRDGYICRNSVLNAIDNYAGHAHDGHIRLGDGVYIGGFCQLHAVDLIDIGDGVVLSEHVYISDLAHGYDPEAGPIMLQPLSSKGPVKVGAHCFVGYGARILPGVSLGEHVVVGANSVVTRSFSPYTMVGGVPARILKKYDHASKKWVDSNE